MVERMVFRIKAYIGLTMAYGAVRCAFNTHGQKKTYHNYNTNRDEIKPMLLTERAGAMLHHSIFAPLVWPYMLAEDAVYLELRLRHEDPKAYGRSPDNH